MQSPFEQPVQIRSGLLQNGRRSTHGVLTVKQLKYEQQGPQYQDARNLTRSLSFHVAEHQSCVGTSLLEEIVKSKPTVGMKPKQCKAFVQLVIRNIFTQKQSNYLLRCWLHSRNDGLEALWLLLLSWWLWKNDSLQTDDGCLTSSAGDDGCVTSSAGP